MLSNYILRELIIISLSLKEHLTLSKHLLLILQAISNIVDPFS